ncbi:MAG: class I SAM-dependent methyltransferase [Bacteriovoracaceae bacterium]|jgi:2-polyprenyl-3-methyl-5-hydroxy-6-metoxy-1,4-benzoquinol methylase|nr:class I SAM-dependent methyltransferase [Bacteriovoracaceae bacterium]
MNCPLCLSENFEDFAQTNQRNYLKCEQCELIYLHNDFYLSIKAEKREYDLHQNSPLDPGYRKFLSRLVKPVLPLLNKNDRGLDFGCGNGPTLSVLFKEQGYSMSLYDPYYYRDQTVFDNKYNFITATEVLEHVAKPKKALEQLIACLKNKGILAIMTKLALDKEAFLKWHYKNDPTHICFYSLKTFNWIGKTYNLNCCFHGKDIIVLSKN